MNILVIGDIFSSVGRRVVEKNLQDLTTKYRIDFIIANGENITHGQSISYQHFDWLISIGVDVVTSGNHIFKKKEALDFIDLEPRLLKPMNMAASTPGKGTYILEKNNKKIRVTNLMGRTFMDHVDNPYDIMDNLLEQEESDIHIVDFHAETTAEKIAFAMNYDGKISALLGTHTHVPTADERILEKGTAFITDIGMCGAINSVIGVNPAEAIFKAKTGLPARFKPALGNGVFNAVILSFDTANNKATSIKRISIQEK